MTLADRVEQASGPIWELLVAAFYEINGSRLQGTIALPCQEYTSAFGRFVGLLDAEAYIDAAMTLLPKGYAISGGNLNENDRAWACVTACHGDYLDFLAEAATEPLARLAAIIRAHEKGGTDND